MIKLEDVARSAGVSVGTASLALNDRPGVSPRTREKVLRTAKEIGYTPNIAARRLASQRTGTIGFIVTVIENPFFGALARSIQQFVGAAGYKLTISISNDEIEFEDQIIYDLIGNRVEGVVIVPALSERVQFSAYEMLARHGVPYVFATSYYPQLHADCVMTNLEEGSYRLVKYLLELGHRRIAFLSDSHAASSVPAFERIRGFRRAHDEACVPVSESAIVACRRADFDGAYAATTSLLATAKPDAIMTLNDFMALGVEKAVKDCGYRVPKDISVAGYDDVVFSSIAEVPLTTVRQDIPLIAQECVAHLVEHIRGSSPSGGTMYVKPQLIVRDSTSTVHHGDPTEDDERPATQAP